MSLDDIKLNKEQHDLVYTFYNRSSFICVIIQQIKAINQGCMTESNTWHRSSYKFQLQSYFFNHCFTLTVKLYLKHQAGSVYSPKTWSPAANFIQPNQIFNTVNPVWFAPVDELF